MSKDFDRRDLIKFGALVGLGAFVKQMPNIAPTDDIEEWSELPTFNDGMVLTSTELQMLMMAILQLQLEVELLRRESHKPKRMIRRADYR